MITFQKFVVPLWRAFAEQRHQHCWKQKTLEVFLGNIIVDIMTA